MAKEIDLQAIVQDYIIRSDYSSKTIDDMILTLHDNPKISAEDIERLIESAQNILERWYS